MICDEKNLLTAAEVCSIVKVCGEAKVAELQFGPLIVRFGTQAPEKCEKVGPSTAVAAEIAETQNKIAKQSLVDAEIETREDQLAELWITNPTLAEELVLKGELEESFNGDRTEET